MFQLDSSCLRLVPFCLLSYVDLLPTAHPTPTCKHETNVHRCPMYLGWFTWKWAAAIPSLPTHVPTCSSEMQATLTSACLSCGIQGFGLDAVTAFNTEPVCILERSTVVPESPSWTSPFPHAGWGEDGPLHLAVCSCQPTSCFFTLKSKTASCHVLSFTIPTFLGLRASCLLDCPTIWISLDIFLHDCISLDICGKDVS